MIGILCEKPSAAKNFAKALGGMNGSYNGEHYLIVNAVGHLYGYIDDAEKQVPAEKAKQYHSWSPDNLPWNENDLAWKYAKKPKIDDILKKINDGLSQCDEISIATDDDPSGEGELLAWEIISHLKNIKANKFTRMFFTDEAVSSIQKSFRERKLLGTNIKCMYDDPDYKQAVYRTRWDYLSMQWTRLACAYTARGIVPRQGRLKSAMVKLVGDQLALCNAYVKKPFYQNRFKDDHDVIYTNKEETKYENKEDVPEIYTDSAVVCDSKAMKSSIPPKFLDLAAMSAALAGKGLRSKTVLDTYQKMYEQQIVSYPRTDDKVITAEQFNELLPLVDKIAAVVDVNPALLTRRSPRATHVKSGGAHGANRPGTNVPVSLDALEKFGPGAKEIYELLAKNYLSTLAPDYKYEHQEGHIQKYPKFVGTANVPVEPGWKAVYGDVMAEEDETENARGLGTTAVPFVYEGANPKPKQPTMKWLMKQLEKYNVGTGATRTSIYSDVTNPRAKYPLLVDRRGKITMADCGEASYALLPDTHISDLKMTEQVYAQMADVAAGKVDSNECLHQIQQMIIDDRETMKANGSKYHEVRKQEAVENQKEHFTGTFKGKEISFSREWGGHRFTDDECAQLLEGKEITIEGLRSKTGRTYGVTGSLSQQQYKGKKFYGFKKISFTGEQSVQGTCPASWCGHQFTDEEKTALNDGRTVRAIDFKSKKGRKFKAIVHYDRLTRKIAVNEFLR